MKYSDIINDDIINAALMKLSRYKNKKPEIAKALRNKEITIARIKKLLENHSYVCGKVYTNSITEKGKTRHLTYTKGIIESVVRHIIFRTFSEILVPKMVKGVSSNIEGRGSTYCMLYNSKRAKHYKYYLCEDIKSYFASVDKSILLKIIIEESNCDADLINLLTELLKVCSKGIAIGTVDCQLWANVYLMQLDRFILSRYKNISYSRYCDNIYIMSNNIKDIHNMHQDIKKYTKRLKLKIHPCNIGLVSKGFRVLSIRIFDTHSLIRKKLKDVIKRASDISSYFGYFKITNSKNLLKTIMATKFSDLTGVPEYVNSFVGNKMPIDSIVDKTIVVTNAIIEDSRFKDNSGKFKLRAKVAFKYNEGDKNEYIFFTSSNAIISAIKYINENSAAKYPIETTVRRNANQIIFT